MNKPNIVLVLADDLGYGDLNCYNPDGKISTPHLDALAEQGMRFTDAHANAAQCSPTRYGILTGRYAWRTKLRKGVLGPFAQPLIEPDRLTVPSLLKKQEYATACVGKWHLGLGWQAKEGRTLDPHSWENDQVDTIDFSRPLTASPLDYGFDYYFGIASSNNMMPYCYIENNRLVQQPVGNKSPVYDSESGKGPVSPDYRSEDIDQMLWQKAKTWLNTHFTTSPKQPFFLYFPTSAIHRPCLPIKEFLGSSRAGLHGDKVVELDDIVGQLMRELKAHGCENNTMFIFTSDNGALPGDREDVLRKYTKHSWGQRYHPEELLKHKDEGITGAEVQNRWLTYGHRVNGPFLGYKTTIYEGGHRVPFIVRWPGKMVSATTSDEIICTTDIIATVAHILGIDLPENSGEDSYSFLPVLLNEKQDCPLREAIVLDSWNRVLSIRQKSWKLIMGDNSGNLKNFNRTTETPGQLYNLDKDPGETTNLYLEYPEKVKELTALFEQYESNGRSAPNVEYSSLHNVTL